MDSATPLATQGEKVRKPVAQKPLSLTAASKAVGVSTSTLRRAIRDEKLKAEKTEEGHYKIAIAELMQYQANDLDTPAARVSTQVEAASVARRAAGGVDIPVAAVSHPVEGDEVLEARIEGLEQQVSLHKDTIRRLEGDVDSWQVQAKSWQQHADNNLRLLEDKREDRGAPVGLVSASKTKFPLGVTAALLVAFGAVALALYPDTFRDLVGGGNTPVVDAAMFEIVPETEPLAEEGRAETEPEIVAVPVASIPQEAVIFPPLLMPTEQ